ncbi:MAG TPA: ADP-ribosylglycohydrolase family protein, partial [Planctomycetota bacterium]|nr:ADP-ribosylglycohydrolase family protein [Planctomycetota bacterium]
MQHDDSATDYASRTTAVFLGVAIADALSFPLIDYSRRFLHVVPRSLTSEYTPHASGEHPIGQFSAETQSLLAVARAISDARGVDARTIAEFLVPLWRDLLVIAPDPSTSEAMQGLVRGVVSDEQSGLPEGRAESGALIRAVPVGIWLATEPESIAQASAAALRITHTDSRVLAAGAGIAAAVAFHMRREEWVLGDFLDCIADAASQFSPELAAAVEDFPRILSQSVRTAWEIIDSVLVDASYSPRPDGMSHYVVPTFLLAIYSFLKSPNDFA